MEKPRFILTGGTICSTQNAKTGLLEPDNANLRGCIVRNFGNPTIVTPYDIDSINFDRSEHYAKLLGETMHALEAGETPIVCGGTDSMSWYATLLTKDLKRRGFLAEGSGQKVLFLSSMKSFGESPQLIERIFEAAKVLMEQPLSGGFAMSARTEDGHTFDVHNVCNNFDKISAELINAFRSDAPAGYIVGDKFNTDGGYQSLIAMQRNGNGRARNNGNAYARIAPPLLAGQNDEAILSYLRLIGRSKAFDGVIIEGWPERRGGLDHGNPAELERTVRQLTDAGVRVIFCNPVHFDERGCAMRPMMHPSADNSGNLTILGLKKAHAEFITGVPKDVYLDAMLATMPQQHPTPKDLGFARKQRSLGLRYVPDVPLMGQALEALAPQGSAMVEHIEFSALPNAAMADAITPLLNDHVRYTSSFTYDGKLFVDDDGKEVVEGDRRTHAYAAGQQAKARINRSPNPPGLRL